MVKLLVLSILPMDGFGKPPQRIFFWNATSCVRLDACQQNALKAISGREPAVKRQWISMCSPSVSLRRHVGAGAAKGAELGRRGLSQMHKHDCFEESVEKGTG